MLQFLVFLNDLGILLKSLGPDTWKLWFLIAWTLALPLFLAGIEQSLPFLSEFGDQLTPQLGLNPSIIFQTYKIWYLSILLCSEFIFKDLSLSQ